MSQSFPEGNPPTPSPFLVALTAALISAPGAAAAEPERARRAANFVSAQLQELPVLFRWAFSAGALLFALYTRVRYGASLEALTPERQVAAAASWAYGSFTLGRHLMRPVRSLALLSYFESGAPVDDANQPDQPSAAALPGGRLSFPRRTQVLIIGSGAGGAVTALELASRGCDVLVLEEGDRPGEQAIDPGSTRTMSRLYRNRGMTPIVGRVPIAYAEGRCVGGSTEINSGFWHRTPPEMALRWKAQFDLAHASPEELAPHAAWAEALLDVGPSRQAWPPSTQVFSRGIERMGWSFHEVPRTAAGSRVGEGAEEAGPRQGMSRTLLPRAESAGARVISACRVKKLLLSGRRAVGVEAELRHGDGVSETVRLEADHLFVCAGPMETPSLLRASGISRLVGRTLRVHPMLKVAARFREPIRSSPATMPLLQVKEFWPDVVLGGAYFSPSHLALILGENWPSAQRCMEEIDTMASYYIGVRGTGSGCVRPSRLEPGRSVIRYDLSGDDLRNLSNGLARMSTMLLSAGAEEVFPAVHGLPSMKDEVEAIRWLDERLEARAVNLLTVHAFSTCPIGEREDRCAADSFGRLRGFDNLYVNDASMLPDSPGVNPQGTIMTLAHRNSVHFCEELR